MSAQQTAALLTTFKEIDMTAVKDLRNNTDVVLSHEQWQKAQGRYEAPKGTPAKAANGKASNGKLSMQVISSDQAKSVKKKPATKATAPRKRNRA